MTGGPVPGLAPRFAAWRVLHDVRHGVPFEVALHRSIHDLPPDDRRLAHELAAGVFRTRAELDRALDAAIDRGLASVRPDSLDVLRLGAFQLLRLDKVPSHAAVQTTVGVARRLGGQRVAGFVNAVLRRVAAGAAPEPGPAASVAELLANRHSHPLWLVERWVAAIGADATERRLAVANRRPPLVVQPNGTTMTELAELYRAQGIATEAAPWGAGLSVGVGKPTELPGFRGGNAWVQDPAQVMVTRFLAPEPSSLVYDACAAPGGKTFAAARDARLVVAADRQLARVRRLAENLTRLRITNAKPVVADVAAAPIRTADAVLLDVPCLGTGTLARNPDARWRITVEALLHLAAQGARFLAHAAEIVSPGGLLLFATCSLEPEENGVQIARFLRDDPRFRREPPDSIPPELLTEDGDLLVLPEHTGTDGAYAARLRKVSG